MTIIILFCLYMGIISFLVWKLKDIKKYPSKYDKIPGYEEYCKSIWYWPTYRDYGKGTPPDNCGLPGGGLIFVLVPCWYVVSACLYFFFKSRAAGGEHAFICNDIFLGGCLMTLLILSMSLSFYVPMYSKRPAAICHNLHMTFRRDSRSTAWEKMTKIVLICIIVVFPLRVLQLYNFGYVNSEKLVYSPTLSFEEQVFAFDNISQIEAIYNEDGSKVKHCYIYNEEGQRFDLAGFYICVDDSQFEIANYIAEHLPEDQKAELQEYAIK